jgi:hypothetical protein
MYTLGAKQKDGASGTPFKTYLILQVSVGTMIWRTDNWTIKEKHTDELCSQLTALIEETTLCFFVVSNTLDGSLIV